MAAAVIKARTAPLAVIRPVAGLAKVVVGDNAAEANRQASLARTAAEDAEAAKEELQDIVDALDPGDPDFLLIFRDAASNIFGKVWNDAAWDILLKTLVTVDGLSISMVDVVGDGYALVVIDEAYNILGSVGGEEADIPDEVVEARGDRSSLDERLSQALDDYGSPRDSFNANRMRRFHYLRRKRLMAESAQMHVSAHGDSYTHSQTRWVGPFADALIAQYGDGGGGWTGFGFISNLPSGPYAHGGTQPSYTNKNARTTYDVSLNGAWTGAYATVPSPDTCCAISSTAGNEIRATFPASPTLSGVDLFWIGTSDGVMEYSWNGSSWTTINVQGTVGACSSASLSGVPGSGSGTLYLRVVSGTCKPAGINWKSAANGVVIHKLAATGSTMSQLATQAAVASWRTAIASLGLTSSIVMHGTNDQGASAVTSQFGSDGETVVTGLRSAIPGIDILWAMPPENQRSSNTFPMSAYKAAAAAKAAALGVAFLDHQRNFGDPANPTEYGSAGATPLFNADLIHPEPATGGRALLDGFLRFLEAA